MTDITMAFMELLRKHELEIDSDFLREGVQIMMQKLIELGAERCRQMQGFAHHQEPGCTGARLSPSSA